MAGQDQCRYKRDLSGDQTLYSYAFPSKNARVILLEICGQWCESFSKLMQGLCNGLQRLMKIYEAREDLARTM